MNATAKKATTPATPARQRPAVKATKPAPAARPRQPAVAARKVVPPALAAAAAKPDKPKKPKLVRDSFTIPKAEYLVLETLKARAVKAGVPAKKSELLRAGIKALADLGDTAFLAALGAVPAIKTGRPAKA
jgi:hypothetical protein